MSVLVSLSIGTIVILPISRSDIASICVSEYVWRSRSFYLFLFSSSTASVIRPFISNPPPLPPPIFAISGRCAWEDFVQTDFDDLDKLNVYYTFCWINTSSFIECVFLHWHIFTWIEIKQLRLVRALNGLLMRHIVVRKNDRYCSRVGEVTRHNFCLSGLSYERKCIRVTETVASAVNNSNKLWT